MLVWSCALPCRRPGGTSWLGGEHRISPTHMLLLVYSKSHFGLELSLSWPAVPAPLWSRYTGWARIFPVTAIQAHQPLRTTAA